MRELQNEIPHDMRNNFDRMSSAMLTLSLKPKLFWKIREKISSSLNEVLNGTDNYSREWWVWQNFPRHEVIFYGILKNGILSMAQISDHDSVHQVLPYVREIADTRCGFFKSTSYTVLLQSISACFILSNDIARCHSGLGKS